MAFHAAVGIHAEPPSVCRGTSHGTNSTHDDSSAMGSCVLMPGAGAMLHIAQSLRNTRLMLLAMMRTGAHALLPSLVADLVDGWVAVVCWMGPVSDVWERVGSARMTTLTEGGLVVAMLLSYVCVRELLCVGVINAYMQGFPAPNSGQRVKYLAWESGKSMVIVVIRTC